MRYDFKNIVDWAIKFYGDKFNLESIHYFKNKYETTPDKAKKAILNFKNGNGSFSLIITEK